MIYIIYIFINFFYSSSFSGNGSQTENHRMNAEQDVLFATNEDCDLYINDVFKGTISKDSYAYFKLLPGNYTYRAKSKLVIDEMRESFTVKEGEATEIFIDLLYFIDEKKQTTENPGRLPKLSENQFAATVTNEQKDAINELVKNMVVIKGGNFIMGNNKAPSGDELEHPVTVNPFRISKYEVTQLQFQLMMGYNPSENKKCNLCPVENVSWEEAMKFIRKINIASSRRFRLPTEAEWEFIAKLGGKAEIDSAGGQEAYIKNTAWYFANSEKKTHAVGLKNPNIAGLYDLFGNVSEWCSDWYGSYYYKDDDSQVDPLGPPLGKEKVYRGGSFLDFTGDRFRPSMRSRMKPTEKSKNIGFRLVLD